MLRTWFSFLIPICTAINPGNGARNNQRRDLKGGKRKVSWSRASRLDQQHRGQVSCTPSSSRWRLLHLASQPQDGDGRQPRKAPSSPGSNIRRPFNNIRWTQHHQQSNQSGAPPGINSQGTHYFLPNLKVLFSIKRHRRRKVNPGGENGYILVRTASLFIPSPVQKDWSRREDTQLCGKQPGFGSSLVPLDL